MYTVLASALKKSTLPLEMTEFAALQLHFNASLTKSKHEEDNVLALTLGWGWL